MTKHKAVINRCPLVGQGDIFNLDFLNSGLRHFSSLPLLRLLIIMSLCRRQGFVCKFMIKLP